MAYNNVSYASATKILEGREEEPEPAYDRYEEPEKWPKLPPTKRIIWNADSRRISKEIEREIGRNEEEIPRKESGITRINIEQENRENRGTWKNNDQEQKRKETTKRKLGIDDGKKREYFKLHNSRAEEITKEKQGIAIKGITRITSANSAEESFRNVESEIESQEEESEAEERSDNRKTRYDYKRSKTDRNTVNDLLNVLKYYIEVDKDVRKEVYAILEGTGRISTQSYKRTSGSEEEMYGKIQQRKKGIMDEDERRKGNEIVKEIQRKYWKARRTEG